ncbi:MFS transporter [Streptomyces sp. SID3343]|uniref:MFS transporter n=1 Tax=Streptomyces sp. SID3343 TaxID=2690260 RepID=UPI001369BF53|nr:MFS transporter [Streptomyces sp. SID3343]MYW00890.1 MFS transporter [Streptomyces sp. SID3343]
MVVDSTCPPPSYAAVLRIRHAGRTFGAALVGRLSYGMVALSLVLAVKEATDSYPVAGTVMALFGATSVLLSPARAALVDRYGPARVLPPMAAVYAALLTVSAVATWRPGVPGLWLGVAASAAGACTPPLGPVMRTLWSELAPDPALLQRAYSLDGVAEEVLFASGPLLVGVLVSFAPPAAGVVVSAALVLTGTLAMVSSPVVRGVSGSVVEQVEEATAGSAEVADPVRGSGLWRAVLVAGGVGLCLGTLDLLALAFAEARDRPEALAWILAALSAGSAVGGLAHGAVTWRIPPERRLPLIALGLGLTLAAAGLSPNLYVLAAAATVTGLFVAPAITTAYLLADAVATAKTRTRTGAWVNTTLNAGASIGTAAIGLLIGRLSLPWCFIVAAAPILLFAVITAAARAR